MECCFVITLNTTHYFWSNVWHYIFNLQNNCSKVAVSKSKITQQKIHETTALH